MPRPRIVHAYPPKPKRRPKPASTPMLARVVTAKTPKQVDKARRLAKLRSETDG